MAGEGYALATTKFKTPPLMMFQRAVTYKNGSRKK
jgi:hypothetical protein